jgi:hypothetical protein
MMANNADEPTACPPRRIRFRDLFLDGETDEEQASSLATALDIIRTKWPHGCVSVRGKSGVSARWSQCPITWSSARA